MNLLKGGTTTVGAQIANNATGAWTDSVDWALNVGGTPITSGSQLTAGTNTNSGTVNYTGSSYGTYDITATGTNHLLTTAANAADSGISINVGFATADTSGSQSAFGTALTAAVGSSASLAGLASKTANSLGTEATLLAGTTASAGTVSMGWRALTGADKSGGQSIVSDVVNLSTPTSTNPFVLQMSFTSGELGGMSASTAFLAWLNGSNQWVNAVTGNTGNNATGGELGYLGNFASFQTDNGTTLSSYIGAYGVDTTADVVWAVVNHNSQFGVMVPEPGTLALLVTGLIGLLAYAWRKRK